MSLSAPAADWPRLVRGLYLTAMAVFLVTIAIGILNGTDAVDFNHDQILTHVHSGTIGWISLSIVAAAAWFARRIDPRLAVSLAVIVPVYVLAFYVAVPWLRAAAGGVLLLLILWLVVWAWQVAADRRSIPAIAIALGLTTFTYGAIIGVLRQIQLAGGPSPFPSSADIVGAHASAMVFSYLILVAMGLLEWRILGTTDRPRGGVVQLGLLFSGGVVISGTLLFLPKEALQPAGGLYLLVELIAVVLFAIRVLPRAVRVDWAGDAAGRHLATSSIFVVVATFIFLYVVLRVVSDPSLVVTNPPMSGVLTASDHAAFIGVITNLMLGLLYVLTADRPDRWSWAGSVVFWAVNLGLIVFLVGLVGDQVALKRIGAPVMGVGLLVGLALAADRLRSSSLRAATER
jgi:energy-converting hydrogenase Eha subunit A